MRRAAQRSSGRAGAALTALAALLLAGCAAPPPLWRAGASRVGFEGAALGPATDPAAIEVFLRGEPEGLAERRHLACGTTTVLRREVLLASGPQPEPTRDWVGLAELSTEDYPRDLASSRIVKDTFGTVFGIGTKPEELFEIELDPAFREEALARLRTYAAKLGADAVIDVFATGEAEFHRWEGTGLGVDRVDPSSPIYVDGKLLGFRLRDVRLHGLAVRYE